jgi:hypothetical protein
MKSSNHLSVDADPPSMNVWGAIGPKFPSVEVRFRESLHLNPRGSESIGVGRSGVLSSAKSTAREIGTLHLSKQTALPQA